LGLNRGQRALGSACTERLLKVLNITLFPRSWVGVSIKHLILAVVATLVQTINPELTIDDELLDVFKPRLHVHVLAHPRPLPVWDDELTRALVLVFLSLLALRRSVHNNIVDELIVSVLVDEDAAHHVAIEAHELRERDKDFE